MANLTQSLPKNYEFDCSLLASCLKQALAYKHELDIYDFT